MAAFPALFSFSASGLGAAAAPAPKVPDGADALDAEAPEEGDGWPWPFNFSYTEKILNSDWDPTALLTVLLSLGSTLKASAIQFVAISMLSVSSAVRVPSFEDVFRKSIIDSARRFLESGND